MSEIKDGILVDPLVTINLIPQIERDDLNLQKIEAIVIHQTFSPTAESTFGTWKTGRKNPKTGQIGYYGAHFVVDTGTVTTINKKSYSGIDGKIYQTARVNKRCLHVGAVRNKIYPVNENSIGIEVVSMYDTPNKTYPPPTGAQLMSTARLIKMLMNSIPTIASLDKVYAHGVISYKDEKQTEGVSTLIGIKTLDILSRMTPFLPLF